MESTMDRLKDIMTAGLLIAGILCLSVPLATGGHKKLAESPIYQGSMLSPDFPVFQLVETR
jgi:hypothetical protein